MVEDSRQTLVLESEHMAHTWIGVDKSLHQNEMLTGLVAGQPQVAGLESGAQQQITFTCPGAAEMVHGRVLSLPIFSIFLCL